MCFSNFKFHIFYSYPGCTVIGCAGSEEKVEYLKEIGFDHAFNYKTVDFAETMKTLCPKGVDCFVDHVSMFHSLIFRCTKYFK